MTYDPFGSWLHLKLQELQVRRGLEPLKAIPEQLLVDRSYDSTAESLGLALTRPRADLYLYARDAELAAAQEQLEHWRAVVLELQQRFRQECIDGRRAVDVDYAPRARLAVQLLRST